MPKTPTKSTPSKTKKPRVAAAAQKKSAAKSAKPKKAAPKSRVAASGVSASSPSTSSTESIVSAADRQRMIQDAAYHLAEKDGFQPGREQHYWFHAEQQIDQLIKGQTVIATGNQQFDAIDTAETDDSDRNNAQGDIH